MFFRQYDLAITDAVSAQYGGSSQDGLGVLFGARRVRT